MATTIDTIKCPHCGFINALAEVDYVEFFKYKNEKFDKREYCPLCDWEMYENDKKKVFVDPKPDQLKEAKKITEFINEVEFDTLLDELINDYILDRYEDLPGKEKKAETFYKGLIEQVFNKKWRQ